MPGLLCCVRSPRPLLKKYACPKNWEVVVVVVVAALWLNTKKAPRPAPINAIISSAISPISRGLLRHREAEGGFDTGGGVDETESSAVSGAGGIVSGVEEGGAPKGACATLPDERAVGKSLFSSRSA